LTWGKVGFQDASIFGEVGSKSTGKSDTQESAGSNPLCPQCGSQKLYRDGLRYPMFGDPIQRWLCRDCEFRFSDPQDIERARRMLESVEKVERQSLKREGDIVTISQICVTETKNLAAEQKQMEVPRRSEGDIQSLHGAIVDFLWQLKKENKTDVVIDNYGYMLHQLVDIGIDLFNPETFLEKMPKQTQWTNTRKYSLTKAYRSFLNHNNLQAKLTKYKPERKLPYIPPEEHLDQLIACLSQMMAALVQTLKETAARPIEALRIEWDDLDIANKKLRINHPAKGSNSRIRPISERLLNMLLSLPRSSKQVFPYKSPQSAGRSFRKMRRRAIKKLGNPELRKIFFYTCRYWRATYEQHKTQNPAAVMLLLGHTSLKYVLLYAQLSEACFGDKGYTCKEAFNRQDAVKLIELGFEYVLTDKEGVSLFRKIK